MALQRREKGSESEGDVLSGALLLELSSTLSSLLLVYTFLRSIRYLFLQTNLHFLPLSFAGDSSPSASSSALPPPPPPSSASKGKRKRERESIGGAGENHQKHNHPHNHLGAVQDGQEDQEEPVDESERLDEQTRGKLLVVLKA